MEIGFHNLRVPKQPRYFKNSIFGIPMRFKENSMDFVIDLSSNCKAEKTILDFLTTLGLSLQCRGTEYIMCIIVAAVNTMAHPKRLCDCYKLVAKKYNTHEKTVEMAIVRAVSSITTHRLDRVNRVFGCEVIAKENLCAGAFLSAVCHRFMVLKSHAMGCTYYAMKDV